jgi:hypothetical protein
VVKSIGVVKKGNERLGVRVPANRSAAYMDRLHDAVGMTANAAMSLDETVRNDFDFVYPFNEMRTELVNGRHVVRIPKFYVRRVQYTEDSQTWREWVICDHKFDNSYVPHEMFLKGNIRWRGRGQHPESDFNDYIYVGKYEMSGTTANTVPNAAPSYATRSVHRNRARALGEGWSIIDAVTYGGLWILFSVVFATRNQIGVMMGNSTGQRANTGSCDGARSTCVNVNNGMSFYGIENLYGNMAYKVDGFNVLGYTGHIPLCIPDYADNTGLNHESFSLYSLGGNIMSLRDANDNINWYETTGSRSTASGDYSTYYCANQNVISWTHVEGREGWVQPKLGQRYSRTFTSDHITTTPSSFSGYLGFGTQSAVMGSPSSYYPYFSDQSSSEDGQRVIFRPYSAGAGVQQFAGIQQMQQPLQMGIQAAEFMGDVAPKQSIYEAPPGTVEPICDVEE